VALLRVLQPSTAYRVLLARVPGLSLALHLPAACCTLSSDKLLTQVIRGRTAIVTSCVAYAGR
jgi:hypothetical protein